MAASTITRDTWTNDTGTAANPNADGTVINNAALQNNVYARVDELFSGAGSYTTLTIGGKISVEGADHVPGDTECISRRERLGRLRRRDMVAAYWRQWGPERAELCDLEW
jgi:hypothetical protein